jgi:hypothetical protein
MFLFASVNLVRVLMYHCWSLNHYRILDIWNRTVNYEVVDVIVCVNVCYMLLLTGRVMNFWFWCVISIDNILNLKIVVLLIIILIISARTLVIEINSAWFGSISIGLKMLCLQTTLLNSLDCRMDRNLICLGAGCFAFQVFNIQAGSYFLRLKTPLNRFNLVMLSDFLVLSINSGLWVWSLHCKCNFLTRVLVDPFDHWRFFSLNHCDLLWDKRTCLSINERVA